MSQAVGPTGGHPVDATVPRLLRSCRLRRVDGIAGAPHAAPGSRDTDHRRGFTQLADARSLSPSLVTSVKRVIMSDLVKRSINTEPKHTPAEVILLLEGRTPSGLVKRPTARQATTVDFSRIRCPLCKWQPKPSHRWFCASCGYPEYLDEGCGTCWNTFTTRGRCPGCGHQWRWTACLNCADWSLHADWYETDSGKQH